MHPVVKKGIYIRKGLMSLSVYTVHVYIRVYVMEFWLIAQAHARLINVLKVKVSLLFNVNLFIGPKAQRPEANIILGGFIESHVKNCGKASNKSPSQWDKSKNMQGLQVPCCANTQSQSQASPSLFSLEDFNKARLVST